jgi:hypothetical protein
MRTYLVRENIGSQTKKKNKCRKPSFLLSLKVPSPPSLLSDKTVMLAAFLRLSFLCGAVRRFNKQEGAAGGGAYTDDSKIKHGLLHPYLFHAVRESVDTMWRGFSRL